MCLPEGEKGPFTGPVCTGDTVQVNVHSVFAGAVVGDGLGQTFCPLTGKLPV
jgi:hypothetical protein